MENTKLNKHTPGPWNAVQDQTHPTLHQIWNKITFDTELPTYIAKTCYAPRSEANSKLISAAPELLEACFTAKAMYEAQGINENSIIGGEQYYDLLKAIKKATE